MFTQLGIEIKVMTSQQICSTYLDLIVFLFDNFIWNNFLFWQFFTSLPFHIAWTNTCIKVDSWTNLTQYSSALSPRGHLKVVQGCTAVTTPFFAFYMFLTKISVLQTQNFKIFIPKTAKFLRKISSLDPTFEKPAGHMPTQKKNWVPLPDCHTYARCGTWTYQHTM